MGHSKIVFRKFQDWLILLLSYWLWQKRDTDLLSKVLQIRQATLFEGNPAGDLDIWLAEETFD